MSESPVKTRLYVTEDLKPEARLRLAAPASHHLVTVLRAKAGESVALFNGKDGEWSAKILRAERKGADLRVEKQRRPQSREPDLWLAFAPVKRAKTDLIAEKATELGASRLLPVMSERCIAERVKIARLESIAREAAEQCGRLSLPEIVEPATLAVLLEDWPGGTRLFFCDEAGGAPPLLEAAQDAGSGPLGLLVGPEGGFSPAERERLSAHPDVVPVSLGDRILRAETAAIAALAILQATHSHARDDLPSRAAVSKCLATER